MFVAEPFPFAEAFERAEFADLGGIRVALASLPDLIEPSGEPRPKDLEDARALEEILRARE